MSIYGDNMSLQTIPENTGLHLIHDNRSGDKLEIVIPVFNEENRIDNILNYYGANFDIVLMDAGSSDRTIEMAIQGGASVYERLGEDAGENHFTFYTNKITKSGYCFYMMADEFIKKSDLKEAYRYLQSGNIVIAVRKIEWIFGEEPKAKMSPASGMVRGLQRNCAAYDPFKMHDSLRYIDNSFAPKKMIVYDLHHLHIKSVKNEYGKFGRYLYIEMSQFIKTGATLYQYFRRYVAPIVIFVFWRAWFNNTSLPAKFFKIMEMVAMTQLSIMCWIEQKFMPSIDEQSAIYSLMYIDEKKDSVNGNDTLSISSRTA